MPSSVTFLVCIPSSNYEYMLKFGKPKDMISLEKATESKQYKLEVELRSKKPVSIPIQFTQHYYNDAFNPTLENISEDDELITMENVSNNASSLLTVDTIYCTIFILY